MHRIPLGFLKWHCSSRLLWENRLYLCLLIVASDGLVEFLMPCLRYQRQLPEKMFTVSRRRIKPGPSNLSPSLHKPVGRSCSDIKQPAVCERLFSSQLWQKEGSKFMSNMMESVLFFFSHFIPQISNASLPISIRAEQFMGVTLRGLSVCGNKARRNVRGMSNKVVRNKQHKECTVE